MTRHTRQPVRITATALRFNQPCLLTLALLLALALLVAGCGVTASNDNAQSQSPDAVHHAWVRAMEEGDENAARALVDPELPEREQFAREAVGRMQEYTTSPASPTGPLEDVSVEPVVDGMGRSVWQFAHKRWCYRAGLISRSEQWYVSRWGQTSVDCQ